MAQATGIVNVSHNRKPLWLGRKPLWLGRQRIPEYFPAQLQGLLGLAAAGVAGSLSGLQKALILAEMFRGWLCKRRNSYSYPAVSRLYDSIRNTCRFRSIQRLYDFKVHSDSVTNARSD
eukprot:g565.t1